MPVTSPIRKSPAAPPPYRPQPVPKVLQTKLIGYQPPANQSVRAPLAPPVYRPHLTPRVLQRKITSSQKSPAGQSSRQPVAPPVYRPEQRKILQLKIPTPAQIGNLPKARPNHFPQLNKIVRPPHNFGVVQRVTLNGTDIDQTNTSLERLGRGKNPSSSRVAAVQYQPAETGSVRMLNLAVVQPSTLSKLSGLMFGGSGGREGEDQEKRRRDEEDKANEPKLMKEVIADLVQKNPQITVIWNSLNVPLPDLKRYIWTYLTGGLTLYRGVQQCHPEFPKSSDYAVLKPKVPGSPAPPDFAANENSWCPMSPNRDLSFSIAISWSHSIAGYFRSRGGMDASRPVALIIEKTVSPPQGIAFCFDGEIQIKGPCPADRVTKIMIGDDLGTYDFAYRGDTFRKWAEAAGVPITNDIAPCYAYKPSHGGYPG